MATNSILKNVTIRDKKSGRYFVSALENASKKKSVSATFCRGQSDTKGKAIKEMFGEKPFDASGLQ